MADANVSLAIAAAGESDPPNPVKGNLTRHDAPNQHTKITSNSKLHHQSSIPSHKDVTAEKIASRASAPTSQPMSKAPSSSSTLNDDPKDDQSSGPAAYGTRSRNRPNALRPNYAEDQDVDFEMPTLKADTFRRSASPDSSSKSRAPSEASRPPTTLRLTTNPAKNPATPLHSIASTENSLSNSPSDAHNEKKKRKVERSSLPKSTANGANILASRESAIPGTSQFSAMPSDNAVVPPPKKRKTSDDQHNFSGPTRRKASSSSHKIACRESCLFTFDKTGAVLQSGKLVADDGTTYAPDGK